MSRRIIALLSLTALALTGCTAVAEQPAAPSTTMDRQDVSSSGPAGREASSSPAVPTLEADLTATTSKKVIPGSKLTGPAALTVLKTLPVKGKAPKTGYNRNAKFGNGWKDFDGDKCDERQDSLARDMSKVKFKDARKCTVASGTLHDLYTGKAINWKVKAGSVDIDHVVALSQAWQSGAQQLSQSQRQALANDPLNLISSDASANRQKGDKNTAEWLPSNKGFRCQYVATQVSVKKKYALSVTAAEKVAMTKVLNTCKSQKAAKVTPVKPGGKATAPQSPSKEPTSPKGTSGKVSGTVSAGAYCKAADQGKRGTSKTGKTYTCKTSGTDTRLRWRA